MIPQNYGCFLPNIYSPEMPETLKQLTFLSVKVKITTDTVSVPCEVQRDTVWCDSDGGTKLRTMYFSDTIITDTNLTDEGKFDVILTVQHR